MTSCILPDRDDMSYWGSWTCRITVNVLQMFFIYYYFKPVSKLGVKAVFWMQLCRTGRLLKQRGILTESSSLVHCWCTPQALLSVLWLCMNLCELTRLLYLFLKAFPLLWWVMRCCQTTSSTAHPQPQKPLCWCASQTFFYKVFYCGVNTQ